MRRRQSTAPSLFDVNRNSRAEPDCITLDRYRFVQGLSEVISCDDLSLLKARVTSLRKAVSDSKLNGQPENGEAVVLRRDVLSAEFDQILGARTIERAKYYLRRLERGLSRIRTSPINDINLLRWKEYDEIITDSLWVLPKRDTSGAHLGWYWGNFIPQIPNQMMLRFTKRGDWVIDPFSGSGTTLIECRRLGRNGIGVEINGDIAAKARSSAGSEANKYDVITEVVTGDATRIDFGQLLSRYGASSAQLVMLHPPYHDILKFSEDERDLSNAATVDCFLKMFGEVVDNVAPVLQKGRHLVLVAGDKYSRGEWIPLGFYCMSEVMKRGFSLKSTIVKNFDDTRAKREQKQLWRYRALVGGFYVFKHEYVFVLKKN